MRKHTIFPIAVLAFLFLLAPYLSTEPAYKTNAPSSSTAEALETSEPEPEQPRVILAVPPEEKTLENDYHVFQTFNNCGPASLSMALSYFDIHKTQKELGQELRPYQNPKGDNDDKSVTLEELAKKAEENGLAAYHRPNGTSALLKLFIAHDIPVIVRTWTKENEAIGHYRIVKGYDDNAQKIIQDDSLQGKNIRFSYAAFDKLWEKFNYEYLVLVPKDKTAIAEAIMGENADERTAWQNAADNARILLEKDPEDIYTGFNLSVALKRIGDYEGSAAQFEKVEHKLPFRTLWYQIEPIEAYFALGNYDRVLALTDSILKKYNRAFSELYLLRGEIYKRRGDISAARAEFEKAVRYNTSMQKAREALNTLAQ